MKVLKFGGTSVGKPERMQQVAKIVQNGDEPKIVVLSALSGTTNALVEIGNLLLKEEVESANKVTENLLQHYQSFIKELYQEDNLQNKANLIVEEHFNYIKALQSLEFTGLENKELLAQGELMSTKLFNLYLQQEKVKAVLLPALEFMKMDAYQEPDIDFLQQEFQRQLETNQNYQIYITQGYICRNHKNEIDNLKRGGSDYTATLIGAALGSEEVQIWTDIDGMHNNDPRIVDKTYPIAELSFNEAAELAYFGAKILHPSSIWPVQQYNVPVRLLNTMNPEAKGTFISAAELTEDVKAVAAKDGITAIKVKSSRMLMAYGFLRKLFEVFEKYKTPIDMITTSEVAVSLTVDDNTFLEPIIQELEKYGTVNVDYNQTIICIVGNLVVQRKGIVKKIFQAVEDYPVRMISYGGSKYNISLLIDSQHKEPVLRSLNKVLFAL